MEVIDDKITIIKCCSESEYLTVLEYADKSVIPVLDGKGNNFDKLFPYQNTQLVTVPFTDCDEQILKTSDTSVHELTKHILSAVNSNARPGKIILASQATLATALCLAKHLRYSVRITDLSQQADTTVFEGNEYIWYMGLAAEIGDPLMFFILKYVKNCFDNNMPLENIPAFSFCTARNAEQLSFLALKIILSRSGLSERAHTFVSIQPKTNIAEFHLSMADSDKQVVPVTDFRNFFSETGVFDVVTCATHGFESCANGGNGNVFCGLKQERSGINLYQYANNLGCGFGLKCPRGPLPFSMENLPARIFMLASCNGLRLADNILNENFNLALSFLDGHGEAYISNFYSSSANTMTVALFNALIKSGYTLGKAVNLLNLFLIRSGLDHPAVLMIGEPDLAVSDEPGESTNCSEIEFPDASFKSLANTHLLRACVKHKQFIEQIEAGQMALLYDTDQPEAEPFWFAYRQQHKKDEVHIFIFAQTGITEDMRFQFVLLNELQESLERLRKTASFWIRFIGYLGEPDDDTAQTVRELGEVVKQIEEYNNYLIRSAGYTCVRKAEAGKLELWAQTVIGLAQQTYLEVVWERISSASFWLLNSYNNDYKINKLGYAVCPNCNTQSITKELTNLYLPESRFVAVCPKCGIVEDTTFPQIFSEFSIGIPDEIYTHSCLRINVEFTCNYDFPGTEFIIVPGISTFGLFNYVPDPSMQILDSPEQLKRYRFNFEFNLEDRVPSHRYFLKVLVVSPGTISFFSRPVFVRQSEGNVGSSRLDVGS